MGKLRIIVLSSAIFNAFKLAFGQYVVAFDFVPVLPQSHMLEPWIRTIVRIPAMESSIPVDKLHCK